MGECIRPFHIGVRRHSMFCCGFSEISGQQPSIAFSPRSVTLRPLCDLPIEINRRTVKRSGFPSAVLYRRSSMFSEENDAHFGLNLAIESSSEDQSDQQCEDPTVSHKSCSANQFGVAGEAVQIVEKVGTAERRERVKSQTSGWALTRRQRRRLL
jgi:hypothetical protein